MSTNTINVLVGLTRASVQKIHYGCFKIVLKAVKCVREFLVSEHSIVPVGCCCCNGDFSL